MNDQENDMMWLGLMMIFSTLFTIAVFFYAFYQKAETDIQRERAEKVLREADYRLVYSTDSKDHFKEYIQLI
jgi:hypothetical protein